MLIPDAQPDRPAPPAEIKARIVAAAAQTLKAEGYRGTTARAIAKTGEFNQALIFYHFGGVDEALLAALDESSERQMARYAAAVRAVSTLEQGMIVAAHLFADDMRDGNIKLLSELIAAANNKPELGPAVMDRMKAWIDFTSGEIRRLTKGSPLARLLPQDDAAFALSSLYLGMQMLTHLTGDADNAEQVFAMSRRVARVLGTLVRVTGGGRRQ
jgi:AcrR family transcriptional regulator